MKNFMFLVIIGLGVFGMLVYSKEQIVEQNSQYDHDYRNLPTESTNIRYLRDDGCGGCVEGSSREKSTDIANNAAAEARVASEEQADAANAAAQQVKIHFAERAMQAAQAAAGVFAGKKQFVEQKQKEIETARALLQQEDAGVEMALKNVNAAELATHRGKQHVNALIHDEVTAKANSKSWEKSLNCKERQLVEKIKNRDLARKRLEQLDMKLKIALEDLTNTKQAACNADEAAKKAQEIAGCSRRKRHVKMQQILDKNKDENSVIDIETNKVKRQDACKSTGSTVGKEEGTTIAKTAEADAKAASDAQIEAANAAAQQVRVHFAEKAIQAAHAAEAVYVGKKQLVEQFQKEVSDAKNLVEQENQSVRMAQNNVAAARQATQRAKQHTFALCSDVKAAKENLKSWEQLLNCDRQQLTEKSRHRNAARERLSQMEKEISFAIEELEKTKQAACNAAEAAKKAQEIAGLRKRQTVRFGKKRRLRRRRLPRYHLQNPVN